MTIEEMKQRKKELGLTNQMLAERSGVPLGTVQKLMSGATKSPRYDTIRALEAVLRADPVKEESRAAVSGRLVVDDASDEWGMLREDGGAYQYGTSPKKYKQGEYTVDYVMSLPEDVRVELIDGFIYDMATPTYIHQAIAGHIHAKFLDFVTRNKGGCFPFISPIGVQLDRDDKTFLEPDVIIVCRREKDDRMRERVLYGAPDFVMEVISPSSVRRDTIVKMNKYKKAGVREYWLLDPREKSLHVYDFEHGDIVYLYTFEDQVPVRIWGGRCEIDLKEMYESIRWLYEDEVPENGRL